MIPDVLAAGPLELRRWRCEIVDGLHAAIVTSFDDLHQWMPWAQTLPSIEELLEVVRRGESAFDEDLEWDFALFERDGGALVGAAGLHRRQDRDCPEIGYWVRSDRTRRGYATAGATALVQAAFVHLADLDRVKIRMDRANGPSAAVARKLGFTLIGEEDREIEAEAHTGTGLVWGLTRTGWSVTAA